MVQHSYPYLDLTVLPEIREHLIAPHVAILLSLELKTVLWTNAEGADLIGARNIRDVLDANTTLNPAMRRQIELAVGKVSAQNPASATMRVRRGASTRLVPFTVTKLVLPGAESAMLVTTDRLRPRSFSLSDMAQNAVDALDGYGHASAILDAGGEIIASSHGFGDLDVASSEREALVREVKSESDRLVKRPLETSIGSLPAGIARLSDGPATHLLIIADTQLATGRTDDAVPAGETVSADSQGDSEAEEEIKPIWSFSNRREPSGVNRMGRWYYKSNTRQSEESDEQSGAGEADRGEAIAREAAEADKDAGRLVPLRGSIEEPAGEASDAFGEAEDTAGSGFSFAPEAKPVRFVWEMDAAMTFASVSGEFARSVGPVSADIVGLDWTEVARLRGLENADEIAELLKRGDTWSGKSVLWPVEGTDLRVPIDLAGLPSYGRNRSFDGFNGFGIIRTADAVVDPEARGLSLGAAPDEMSGPAGPEPARDEKIVDLGERRSGKTTKALSSGEREAFDEIGDKLATGETPARKDPATDMKEAAPADFIPSAFVGKASISAMDRHALAADPLPPAQSDDSDVDTSILARLPIPVLVYRREELLFGNEEFFGITGYENLHALADAGGVEALFGTHADPDEDTEAPIFHRDGSRLAVRAHLQRVPWDADRAMLLTLRRDHGGDGDGTGGDDDTGETSQSKLRAPSVDTTPFVSESHDVSPPTELKAASDSGRQLPPADTADFLDEASGMIETFGGLNAQDLRNILDTATDGVIVMSDDGVVRAINRSAEALFDIDPEKIVNRSITRLLAPESHRSAMDYIASVSGPGVGSLLNDGREIIGRTDKGGLIPLFMTVGKLEKAGACCAVMRDITHWKRAEEELVNAKSLADAANAQKSEFLAKVSHEIRTPLNAIIGFSDMMIEERFGRIDNDRYRGYLRDIHRSGNHVLELVNDLLDISKIEAGKVDLDFDACDLNAIVSETVALSQPDANKERVIIRTSLSAAVPKVVADPRSLRQIILNLVSNAIKFTKSGGQVIVSTVYDESGEVALRVRDTGVGMSEIQLARALKPFQQVNAVAGSQKQGTGLGLPLTKALVEANRALFHIESRPDEGTLVEVHFPIQRVLADH